MYRSSLQTYCPVSPPFSLLLSAASLTAADSVLPWQRQASARMLAVAGCALGFAFAAGFFAGLGAATARLGAVAAWAALLEGLPSDALRLRELPGTGGAGNS
eukprot:1044065-Prymnesium_polylepis.1